MSKYRKSKSQKRSSQSQSKNGGRRRKRTMRKLRRGRKSRKVMRGGLTDVNSKLNEPMVKNFDIEKITTFLTSNNINLPDNIDTITYIDMRKYVSEQDKTTDMNIIDNFNEKFPRP